MKRWIIRTDSKHHDNIVQLDPIVHWCNINTVLFQSTLQQVMVLIDGDVVGYKSGVSLWPIKVPWLIETQAQPVLTQIHKIWTNAMHNIRGHTRNCRRLAKDLTSEGVFQYKHTASLIPWKLILRLSDVYIIQCGECQIRVSCGRLLACLPACPAGRISW